MSTRNTLASGIALNARVDGAEDSPWLILSNSLGSNLDMWAPQMEMLLKRFRVLRYDTRGHGGSDAPPGPYGFDDFTGDVLGLMDAHGIQRASFMGLSLGGMTGLGLALDHAERFERIVCADARADAPEPFRAMWDQRIAAVEAGGLEAIVEGTLASWLTEDWRGANPDKTEDIRRMVRSNDPKGYIACCHGLKTLNYLYRLPDIKLPILYVGGSNDMGAAPAVMSEMAAATPGGIYREIPGAAHVANINAPDAFNAAIDSFLSS